MTSGYSGLYNKFDAQYHILINGDSAPMALANLQHSAQTCLSPVQQSIRKINERDACEVNVDETAGIGGKLLPFD
jgi:hypothetical protein